MEAPAPLNQTKENKNEYIFKINDKEFKLIVFIENQYIIFTINQLNKLSLYYYENKYEFSQIIELLNLNSNLYNNLENILELIHEAYLNKKISLNITTNNIEIIIKFTIGFKEYEYSIVLYKKEYNINDKFQFIFNELFLLKKSKNEYLNEKLKLIEDSILDLKELINKKFKENEIIINELKNKIKDNKNILEKNKKELCIYKNEILYFNMQMKLSSICKIVTPSGNIGCGFLMKIYKGEYPFFYLIADKNIINKNIVKSKEIVELFYDWDKKVKIELNKNQRFILDYSFLNIDAIVIEILPKDDINDNFFLSSDLIYRDDFYKLKNRNIYMINFKNNNQMIFVENQLTSLNQYEFIYSKDVSGIPGSPIFLEGKLLLGINKKKGKKENKFSGNTLIPIIDSLKVNLEFEKSIIGKDSYQGFSKNRKFEGYGKYIYENGNYYIGQFSNGFKNGYGTEYYKNNTIKYDGIYNKDKCDKYGKYVYENGNYYVGQFLNGLKHGNGIEYYKNNIPKYEGDFVYGKCEGYGKYIYESGNYYIGEFLNGLKHGKGILYYKNNKIKYEGDFVKDKCEGYGKFNYENGEYYIGQFSDNKRNGKGKLYSKDNNIKFEGNFIDGEIVTTNK